MSQKTLIFIKNDVTTAHQKLLLIRSGFPEYVYGFSGPIKARNALTRSVALDNVTVRDTVHVTRF